jgi:hypothetical protein
MKSAYYPPKVNETNFHCPYCNVYSHQIWNPVYINIGGSWEGSELNSCICTHCNKRSYWLGKRMVLPDESPVEPPHPDLPPDLQKDFSEARSIFSRSPRAAAALLRLCV